MGCEVDGKTAVMKAVFDGAELALGLATKDSNGNMIQFTEISKDQSINPGYARMPIEIKTGSSSKTQTTLYLTLSDGTVTNNCDSAFKDADDGVTFDSLDSHTEGGWKNQVDSIGIYKNNVLYYAAIFKETPINIYQSHRIRLTKGNFKITFDPQETDVSQSAVVSALNLESDIKIDVEE